MQRRGFFGAIAGALAGVASLKLLPKQAPIPAAALEPTIVLTKVPPRVDRYLVRTTWHRNAGDIPAKYSRVDHFLIPGEGRAIHVRTDVESCPFHPVTPGHFYEQRHV